MVEKRESHAFKRKYTDPYAEKKSPEGKGQSFDLGGFVITSLMLDNLKKADDPSPFPALTQLEVWGTNVCD